MSACLSSECTVLQSIERLLKRERRREVRVGEEEGLSGSGVVDIEGREVVVPLQAKFERLTGE